MEIVKPGVVKARVSSYTDKAGETIRHIVLQNGDSTVELTNIGCAVTAIYTPDSNAVKKNIVAGFSDLELYKINNDYFGCVIGRYANRIAGGKFILDGTSYQLTVNDAPNHLHGGLQGFSHKIWTLDEIIETETECGAVFSYFSPDGEEGYPGNLAVTVKYVLDSNRRLSVFYKAGTDKRTPVNLTNHSYFNLTGFEQPTISGHRLQVNGDWYTEKSVNNTSTGGIIPVRNTALDFTIPKLIGNGIDCFPEDMGYDHNFVLNYTGEKGITKAAVLSEETTGRVVTVYTDKPAIQVYTANYWNGAVTGMQGVAYQKHGGVALETQFYPDSVNHMHFPGTILQPGEAYTSVTVFEFGLLTTD